MKKNLVRWLGLIVLPIICTGCQLMPEEEMFQEPPVLYSYEIREYAQDTVMRGELILSTTVDCTYMAARQELLGFELGGEYIEKIYVSEGQKVQKGQLLAELQHDNLKEEITAAEYECKVLKLKQKHLLENQNLKQQEEPEGQESPGQQESPETQESLEQQEDSKEQEGLKAPVYQENPELQAAADEVYLAELRLEELKQNLAKRQIYAGMDGTVVQAKKLRDGVRSASGETVVTIADIDTNVFQVRGEEAQYFTPGMHTTVQCGKTVYEVDVVDAEEFGLTELQQEGGTAAYLRLVQPDPTLEDGKRGKIEVILEKRSDVLYVPSGTVQTADGKQLVYTLDENGLRVMQNVETGLMTEDYIEITSGLEEGDIVIR